MTEAMAVQYLMKPRRLTPALRSISPTVSSRLLGDMILGAPIGGRRFAYPRAQMTRGCRDLVQSAGKNCRHWGYFDRFGEEFLASIKMLDPPDSGYLSFSNPGEALSIHARLHLAFTQHLLKLRAILWAHGQAAQVDARRGAAVGKALEQPHEFRENRADTSA